MKFLECIELKILQVKIRTAVKEQFVDSHNEFIDELFKEEEPMMKITRQYRDSFALLYSECKQQTKSFMQFLLQWHYHCSAFLLEEKFTLAAINLEESAHASLVATRKIYG